MAWSNADHDCILHILRIQGSGPQNVSMACANVYELTNANPRAQRNFQGCLWVPLHTQIQDPPPSFYLPIRGKPALETVRS